MKKKLLILAIIWVPCLAWALGSWTFYNGTWYNSTTGQTQFYPQGTLPPFVTATYTPTITPTPAVTFTPTVTFTPLPTPWFPVAVLNSDGTLRNYQSSNIMLYGGFPNDENIFTSEGYNGFQSFGIASINTFTSYSFIDTAFSGTLRFSNVSATLGLGNNSTQYFFNAGNLDLDNNALNRVGGYTLQSGAPCTINDESPTPTPHIPVIGNGAVVTIYEAGTPVACKVIQGVICNP